MAHFDCDWLDREGIIKSSVLEKLCLILTTNHQQFVKTRLNPTHVVPFSLMTRRLWGQNVSPRLTNTSHQQTGASQVDVTCQTCSWILNILIALFRSGFWSLLSRQPKAPLHYTVLTETTKAVCGWALNNCLMKNSLNGNYACFDVRFLGR